MILKNLLCFISSVVFSFSIYAQSVELSNFNIENNQKDRIYFESSSPLSGSSTQGFYVSGKTVTGVSINSGQTSGHYFTVNSSFDFWDNNTIRYEGGSDLNAEEFTLSYIENNIVEPEASDYRYVTTSASGGGNGQTEGTAWTLQEATQNASAGMTIWIKSGNYGDTRITLSRSGTASNPIKYIGYRNSIGDITSNYYDYGVSWSTSQMPTLTGSSTTSGNYGITISGDYFILRNIQATNHNRSIYGGSGSPDHFIIDRFNVKDNYHSTQAGPTGIHLLNNSGLNNFRILNTTLINCSMAGIAAQGANVTFNLIDGIKSYNNQTGTKERQDYHISINGDHNIIRNCYVENFNNTETNGSTHGIGIKGAGRIPNEYNLIEKSTAVNNQEGFYFRNYGCNYSVIKDCVVKNNGAASYNDRGGVWLWGGVNNNVIERVSVSDVDYGIGIRDNEGEDYLNDASVGDNNIIRNSTFNNVKYAIYSTSTLANANFDNNKILNCTFHNAERFHAKGKDHVIIRNLEITNCTFSGVSSVGTDTSGMVFDSNNFYNSWTNSLGTNSINVDPNFENASGGNFQLKSNSPLINKGRKLNEVKSDFSRNPRPQGGGTDIGAYEYNDGTTTSVNADAGEDQTICSGDSVTLTATGGSSYLWSTGATTSSIDVNPSATTEYSVTVSEGGSSDTDEVLVTVNSINATAGSDVTIESGESTTLTASGGDSYQWSTGATTSSITVSPSDTTTYTVEVKRGLCEDTASVEVTVTAPAPAPAPVVTADAGEDQTICSGDSVTLTATGGSSYLWSTGATTSSIDVNPSATTEYSVTVSEGGSSDTDEVLVTVNSINATAGSDVTIESGESTTLTASGGDSYQWSTGATTSSITVSPSDTTTYTVEVKRGSCEDTASVEVTVTAPAPAPAPVVTADAGEDQTICSGDSVTLTATGGSSYLWSTGATTSSIDVNPSATTEYSVTVSEGGSSDTDEVLVTVNSINATAGSDVTIESGESTTLTASGGDSYQWSTGATTSSITVSPSDTTTYTVEVKRGLCEDTASVEVTVTAPAPAPAPVVTADAGEDQTICSGDSVTLTATGGSSYLWSTGATTSSIDVNPDRTTTYSIEVSQGEYNDTAVVTIYVENCSAELEAVSSIEENPIISVYPNPTNGVLNINIQNINNDFDLQLIDLHGSILKFEKISTALDQNVMKQIDMSSFTKGIYFVRFTNENQYLVKKVILI